MLSTRDHMQARPWVDARAAVWVKDFDQECGRVRPLLASLMLNRSTQMCESNLVGRT